jgi:carboxyl-terminal processing protease
MTKAKVSTLMVTGAILIGFVMGSFLTGQVHAESGILSQLKIFSEILRHVKANYVEEVDSEEMVEAAIRGMLEELDPHSNYVEPEAFSRMNERNTGEYEGIGISFEMRDGWITVISAIEGGPSAHLGIRPGDRIVAIEGESAEDLANEDVVSKLKGPKGTTVNITVARPGLESELAFAIVRDKIPIYSVPYSFMLDDEKTGYIRMIRFSATTAEELETSLEQLESAGMQRLILDLRNNSGGFLNQAIEVADRFIDGNQVIVYTKGRIEGSSQHYYSTDQVTHERYPLIVLVNHGSASASEIVSGAIQDHDRGVVAGLTTFGKGLVQRQYMLNDGAALLLTVARYYTPSGRLIQRPYKDRDEYMRHWGRQRDENETDDAVSAEPDTAGRPIHHTLNEKRVVYGGGGITPDIQIHAGRDPNEIQIKLEASRLFFEFANEYAARNLSADSITFSSFLHTYQVPDAAIEDFKAQALTADRVDVTREELDGEMDYIQDALKRELAGNLWGLSARYRVFLEGDVQLAEALKHFPEAEMMVKIYDEAVGNQR